MARTIRVVCEDGSERNATYRNGSSIRAFVRVDGMTVSGNVFHKALHNGFYFVAYNDGLNASLVQLPR